MRILKHDAYETVPCTYPSRSRTMVTALLNFLYLGSKQDAKDLALLKELKITHILNVTPSRTKDPIAGVPNFFLNNDNFTYKRCAIFDSTSEDITSILDGCIAFIEQGRLYGKVLVHCVKGVSRSASIVMGYLMKIKGFTYKEAYELVKSHRKQVRYY